VWILTEQLIISHFALDTKVLEWDSETFGRMCEKSLMWRSKPSQSRTWRQRLKRVGYIQRLFTRTLKPSHSNTFLEKWISSLPDSRVNPLVLPEDENQQMIRDIYTHISLKESHNADQLTLFSKMSKESSQAKPQTENRYSSMSSETWKKEVISHRGEYSQRLKLVRPINENESLSWPTARNSDAEGGRIETEMSEKGFRSKRHKSDQYFGAKLRDAVEHHEEKNWISPTTVDIKRTEEGMKKRIEYRKSVGRKYVEGCLSEQVDNQEKNWATPNTMDHLPPKEGEAMQRLYDTHRKGRTSPSNLREQVNPKSWPTPTTAEAEKISNKANYGQKGLSNHPSIVGEPTRKKGKKDRKGEKSWPTPKARDWKGGMGTSKARQKRDLDKIVHLPNTQQDQEKSSASGKSQESWPTMSMPQGGAALNNKRGKNAGHPLTTAVCMEKKAKTSMKLNPNWVEQLMGLPVGWTQLPTEWTD